MLSNGKVLNKECKQKKQLACWPARKLKKMGKKTERHFLRQQSSVLNVFLIPFDHKKWKIFSSQFLFSKKSFQFFSLLHTHKIPAKNVLIQAWISPNFTYNPSSHIWISHKSYFFNTTLLQSVGMMMTKGLHLSVNSQRKIINLSKVKMLKN